MFKIGFITYSLVFYRHLVTRKKMNSYCLIASKSATKIKCHDIQSKITHQSKKKDGGGRLSKYNNSVKL